jgi:hypothetical protein
VDLSDVIALLDLLFLGRLEAMPPEEGLQPGEGSG